MKESCVSIRGNNHLILGCIACCCTCSHQRSHDHTGCWASSRGRDRRRRRCTVPANHVVLVRTSCITIELHLDVCGASSRVAPSFNDKEQVPVGRWDAAECHGGKGTARR